MEGSKKLEPWKEGITSQWMQVASQSDKRHENGSPLDSPEEPALPTSWLQPSETDHRVLNSRTLREYIWVFFCHQTCSNLLEEQQETNTDQIAAVIATDAVVLWLHRDVLMPRSPETQQLKLNNEKVIQQKQKKH